MEMEFTARVDAVDQLLRAKQLTAFREGRARTAPLKILWHDSPDRALQAAGRTVSEQRGTWRLECLQPAATTWLPGQPAVTLVEAPDVHALDDLPAPLAPIAAFEGKRTVSQYALDTGSVRLTAIRGALRSVTATTPAARLWLDGDPDAVHAAALSISQIVPITVPTATLAAQGIALATGETPPPRRSGAPKLPGDASLAIDPALRHILGHLLDVVLYLVPAAIQRDHASIEAVHQMRVAVRRARSALKLFGAALHPDELQPVIAGFRTIGANLGPTRDWDVFLGETLPTIRDVLPSDDRLDRLAAAAERRRQECRKEMVAYLTSSEFRTLTIELAWSIASFRLESPAAAIPPPVVAEPPMSSSYSLDGAAVDLTDHEALPVPPIPQQAAPIGSDLLAFASGVIGRRHRKLVASGKHMRDMDIPALHGVRLRAKQVRYAAEMFSTLYPGRASQRFIRRLSILQECLGTLNDSAVASHLMDQIGGAGGRHAYAVGVITGYLAARTAKIRPRIMRAFRKFKHQAPYWT